MPTERGCRVLLVGIDSASLDLVLRWRDELPTLAQLMRTGTFGFLRSTVPPISAPAWTSMVTGKNPGKTGVFDWVTIARDLGELKVAHLGDVKEPKIWDVLTDKGMRSCVINLPLSYPPSKLNGVMVSGIPGHVAGRNITYPASLREGDMVVGGYEVHPYVDLRSLGREQELIRDFERIVEKRTKASLPFLTDLHKCPSQDWTPHISPGRRQG